MTPKTRRNLSLALIVFFLIMCAAIGFSQWWAYHVNVPAYERAHNK